MIGDTNAVGNYPEGASPFGVLDMSGNVWEWTNDLYADNYLSEKTQENPLGPTNGVNQVMRGGSFMNFEKDIRINLRYGYPPEENRTFLGFRCMMTGN